ncbi:MAG: RnfABCDGE type electron transport complex subunit G [Pseudoflavonifractor sp.]|nr:RnfABCDGE type electron transport complex subunit G [Pseudoflavonifractor sp.]
MSETAVKKNDSGMAKLTITLFAICAVCALVLGMVNMITEQPIKDVQAAKNAAAMSAVLPADGYAPVEYTGTDTTIKSINKAGDAGYVVEVSPSGSFSGTLSIMVGVNADQTVSGVEIVKSGETSGLGDNAKKADWREQFKGLTGEVKVTKDGGSINAITGATITSRAVSAGVTSALAAVAELG